VAVEEPGWLERVAKEGRAEAVQARRWKRKAEVQ